MWVFMNDAMFSAVEDENDSNSVVVRARLEDDLKTAFGPRVVVIESEDSDYRFRIFTTKDHLKLALTTYVDSCLNYPNFKGSIDPKDKVRYEAYTGVWTVLYRLQERLYPRSSESGWWMNYRNNG